MIFTSILMGGGIVQGQVQQVTRGLLTPHGSCIFQTDTFYGNSFVEYYFISDATDFELTVQGREYVKFPVIFENMLVYNANDSLLDQYNLNQTSWNQPFTVPSIGDTFLIRLETSNPPPWYEFDICLEKPVFFRLFHSVYAGGSAVNYDICEATFYSATYGYYAGYCEMTHCTPDSMVFKLNSNLNDPNYRFEWTFHGVNGIATYVDYVTPQPKLRDYSNIGYDTVDVFFFDQTLPFPSLHSWVQLVIKTVDAPVVTATVEPTPVCPSCNNGLYQDTVVFDYNAYNFYECTNHWIYWHNGTPNNPVGQPPYSAWYTFTGVDSVTVWWENECGMDEVTLPVYISNQPYFTYDTVCVGSPTNLYAQTNCPLNTFTSYEWAFGNGNTASGPVVNYIFPNSGTFPVQLTITDDCGNTESYTNYVIVHDLPQIEAELEYNNNCTSNTINAWINNPDPALVYSWNIPSGVGTVSPTTGSNVVITWNPAALTNPTIVTVTATNPNTGCSSSIELEFFQCCENPNATINWTDEVISSAGTYSNSDYIMINGEVTFDADQDFTGTNIWFGPMAKINVSPGVNTSFTKCALSAGCDYMWQGIELIDNTTTIEVSGSKILDAIDFVISNDGAYYNIHDNDAVKNNNCVLSVINAPAGFTGVFSNNNISCDANTIWPPYENRYSFCGVSAERSQNVNIGPDNVFNNLLNGIWSKGSELNIHENTFKNINKIQFGQSSTAAIYLHGGYYNYNLLPHWKTTVIGGSNPTDGNLFQRCISGVVSDYSGYLEVENNDFTRIERYGVHYSYHSKGSNVWIANNTFTANAVGVMAYMNPYCISLIENNSFNWNGNPLTAFGVRVLGTKFKYELYTITNNTFNKPKTGIEINTVFAPTVESNTIENLRNNSGPFTNYGIKIVNTLGTQVSSNTITPSNFNLNQPAASSNINTGIRIENSWETTLNCNVIRKTGICLNVSGANPMTTLTNNDFVKGYYGIYTSNSGYTGDIGDDTHPADNQWVGIHNLRQQYTPLSGSPELMYCRNTSTYWPVYHQAAPYIPTLTTSTPPIIGRPQQVIISSTSKAQKTLTQDIQQITPESKAWVKKGMNKIVKNDVSLISDSILSFFIDTIQDQPIGVLDSVLVLRENEMLNEASIVNSSIVPETYMDELEIEVNNYYLTLESGQSISTYENRIREIAEMCPFTEGEGVYKARILMEMFDPFNTVYFNECEDERAGKSMEFAQNIEPDFNVTVFPNPATDAITIEIQSVESNFELIVYDHTGKEVLNTELYDLISIIDLKQLEVGFYSYIIISSSGQVSTGKFSILAH